MSKTNFKELLLWKLSKELAVEIYKLTTEGMFAKDYSLKDQIRRAAVSVPSNIAEGNDRGSDKEMIRFLYISKGSLAELITQLYIACEVDYITEAQLKKIEAKCNDIGAMIGKFIKVLSERSNIK